MPRPLSARITVSEPRVHDVDRGRAGRRMAERVGDGADDGEPERLPEADGAKVGGDDGVELHRLEAERLMKRLDTKHAANEQYLNEQRTMLDENTATLEGLRQKAELFAQRPPVHRDSRSEFDDAAWTTRDLTIGDDEIEIAYLREKSLRSAS